MRALVRRPDAALPAGVEAAPGDLMGGTGLAAAADGVGHIVHLASGSAGGDTEAIDIGGTAALIEAARAVGSPHLLYLSIVGIERVPFPYYAVKVRVEALLAASGLPWTSLRTTQFHELIEEWAASARPVFGTGVSFQPVATSDVSDEVVRLLRGGAANAVLECGGPEVLTSEVIASKFAEATGRPPFEVTGPRPGSAAAAFAGGGLLTPEHRQGRVTWRQYLASRA